MKTTNTLDEDLVLRFGGLPPVGEMTDHTVAAGATFEQEFPIADDTFVGAIWKDQITVTALHHTRPKSCTPGGGGGLPTTGTRVTIVAGAGLLLVLFGAGIYALTRRRRPVE